MNQKLALLTILFGILTIPVLAPDVFGHGLGGDQAAPVDYEGRDVTISTVLNPSDITVGTVDTASMNVRFFDADANENINDVTYGIEIWHSDKLLARNNFFDADGSLDVDIRPDPDCDQIQLWKCTKTFGELHPIAGAYYTYGTNNPIIEGPIFEEGGLYNIKVSVLGAESPRTLLASPLNFDLFVSVAQEQPFTIKTANAEEIPAIVKTYYDEVKNFQYDSTDKSIYFEMPFTWEPSYVEQVLIVHEEVRLPKDFAPYAEGKQFKGYVNGVEISPRALLNDPYTYDDTNIVHFLIPKNELQRINDILGPDNYDSDLMSLKLIPQSEISKNTVEFHLVDTENYELQVPTNVVVQWDGRYGAGEEIPFEITFFDQDRNLIKDVKYAYQLFDANNKVLSTNKGSDDPNNPGILAVEGLDIQNIMIPEQGSYRLDIRVYGTGVNYDETYAGIGSTLIEIGPSLPKDSTGKPEPPVTPTINVPEWVKDNAGAWANDEISSELYVTGLQYLIDEEVITIPPTSQGQGTETTIPEWVKDNARWWANDEISTELYVTGLQYLIQEGIIIVS